MATKKITELASLAGTDVASSTDVLPIVDINADATKKVTVDGLHTNSTFTGTATFNGAITASTDISASGNVYGITGSFSHVVGNSPITFGDPVTFNSPITASLGISGTNSLEFNVTSSKPAE